MCSRPVGLRKSDLGKTLHGMTHTPEHQAYRDAKNRCVNKNNTYWESYGDRGIKFLFDSFLQFFKEVGLKPVPKEDYELDRIENEGNYEPGNVRWAMHSVGMMNRRKYKNNTSGYRGVSFNKARGLWYAYIGFGGKLHGLGLHETAKEAAEAYNEAAKLYHKAEAKLNTF